MACGAWLYPFYSMDAGYGKSGAGERANLAALKQFVLSRRLPAAEIGPEGVAAWD
jgi:hypothetical protein